MEESSDGKDIQEMKYRDFIALPLLEAASA
jgi:hypothetical protein